MRWRARPWGFLSDWACPAAVVALCFLTLAGIALPLLLQRLAARPGAQAVSISATLKASMVDVVDGLGELIVFGAMSSRLREIDALGQRWIACQKRLSHLTGLSNAGFLLLTYMAVLGSTGLMVVLVRAQRSPAIDFAPLILLVLGCFEAVAQMPAAWQSLGELEATSRRLRAFEVQREAIVQPRDPAPPTDDTLHFSHVGVRHAQHVLVLDRGALVAYGPHRAGRSGMLHREHRNRCCIDPDQFRGMEHPLGCGNG